MRTKRDQNSECLSLSSFPNQLPGVGGEVAPQREDSIPKEEFNVSRRQSRMVAEQKCQTDRERTQVPTSQTAREGANHPSKQAMQRHHSRRIITSSLKRQTKKR